MPPSHRSPSSRVSVVAAALALAACSGPRASPPGAAVVSGGVVAPLFSGAHSGYEERAELAVRDSAAWADAWRQLHQGAPQPAPTVDFARDMVLVVALGQRSSGGVDVTIDSVTADDAGATAHYTVREPGEGCMSAQVMTTPAVAVRTARTPGEVRFVPRVQRVPC